MQKLTLKIIGDNTARAQAFEAGDLDAIQSPLSPQDIARLAKDQRFGNVITAGLGVTYINFNTRDPLLAEPKMRQGVRDARRSEDDRRATSIAASIRSRIRFCCRLPGLTPPASGSRPSISKAAAALFAEMGWKKDDDGCSTRTARSSR